MTIASFSKCLAKIEQTSSRNEMTTILAELLKDAAAEDIKYVVYLALGSLGPLYDRVDFGLSNKLVAKSIAEAFSVSEEVVNDTYNELGDYGDVVFKLHKDGHTRISVLEVYTRLMEIAKATGKGSQQFKITEFAKLLQQLDAVSAKFCTRIPLSKLRLGFSDVTILDALSVMLSGDKTGRKTMEQAYNIVADIGVIAEIVKDKGLNGLSELDITLGIPIRPAAAERLPTAQAIIEKLGNVASEPKIDGFRLQVHYQSGSQPLVKLYSRNLEDMSEMFPDLVVEIQKLPVTSIIFEGEAVAYNTDTEEFLPFQETIQRRRKYDIEEMAESIPLKLFAFELLYLDGKSYLPETYTTRREALERVMPTNNPKLSPAPSRVFDTAEGLAAYFMEEISHGLEGIMAKRLDAPYAAGARNSNWIKLKREEKGDLDDSIDCVVLGYKYGTGKRTAFGIGAFLVGVYDEDSDMFMCISNVGTGLTDDQWREMKKRADELKVDAKPARYDIPKELEQDVWIDPQMVVEILADEITRSPLHTAGKKESEQGYALRFPRLIKWRDDKNAEQSTSVQEIKALYKQQR